MQILPVHLDLFALVIFLGVAQGLFLGIFFLVGERARSVANRCLGWFTLALVATSAEIFLNYTNYTFRVLWLVDVSEPLNFVLGPLFYLFVFSRLQQRLPRRWGWHFLPFVIWLVNALTWVYQPVEFKYNSYVNSQHPELPYISQQLYWEEDFTEMRHLINEMTLLSCVVYAVLALLAIRNSVRQGGLSQSSGRFSSLRLMSLLFALAPCLIALVKPQFYHDVGDYLLATYLAGVIYTMSFLVMRGSSFFGRKSPRICRRFNRLLSHWPGRPTPAGPKKKYEKSALSEEVEEAVLAKLNRLLTVEKPHLQPDLSLPKLAQLLSTSPHHLSQVLNDRLGQTFFDWLATHRITEAQRLLNDPATAHLKIDEIAERVGYNSPSAFHTAFKRITNQTPAQFRANLRQPDNLQA